MPLAKCPRTGKLFDNSKGLVHPEAQHQEEEDYNKILDYLAEHPNAKPDEVIEQTGVTMECIHRMVKSGRVREMDHAALRKQAEEFTERAAEVAKRNQRVANELNLALRGPGAHVEHSDPLTPSVSADVRSTYQSKRDKI
jgi:hypothetical protein